MNRFASLIALVIATAVVAAMSASFTGTSLALVTVLVASGVLVYRFAQSQEVVEMDATHNQVWAFASHLVRHLFRFAVGALVIAWMVVSLLWFVVG